MITAWTRERWESRPGGTTPRPPVSSANSTRGSAKVLEKRPPRCAGRWRTTPRGCFFDRLRPHPRRAARTRAGRRTGATGLLEQHGKRRLQGRLPPRRRRIRERSAGPLPAVCRRRKAVSTAEGAYRCAECKSWRNLVAWAVALVEGPLNDRGELVQYDYVDDCGVLRKTRSASGVLGLATAARGRGWLAAKANAVLRQAEDLAAELAARQVPCLSWPAAARDPGVRGRRAFARTGAQRCTVLKLQGASRKGLVRHGAGADGPGGDREPEGAAGRHPRGAGRRAAAVGGRAARAARARGQRHLGRHRRGRRGGRGAPQHHHLLAVARQAGHQAVPRRTPLPAPALLAVVAGRGMGARLPPGGNRRTARRAEDRAGSPAYRVSRADARSACPACWAGTSSSRFTWRPPA